MALERYCAWVVCVTLVAMCLVAGAADGGRIPTTQRPGVGTTLSGEEARLAEQFGLSADDARIFVTTLGAVQDNISQWREAAFFLLLGHTSAMPELTAEEFGALDQPAYKSLLDEPGRYRCRQVRMKVRVYRVLKQTSGKGIGPSMGWPRGKVTWRLKCTTSVPKSSQGMMIFSVVEPPLGEPSKVTSDGELLYDGGRELDVAAVFYKTYRDEGEGAGGAKRNYPLLVARAVRSARKAAGPSGPSVKVVAGILGIIALGVTYYVIRRRVKAMRVKGAAKYDSARQKRELAVEGDTEVAGDEEDDSVDPLLQKAARQYQQERRHEDGTDHQG